MTAGSMEGKGIKHAYQASFARGLAWECGQDLGGKAESEEAKLVNPRSRHFHAASKRLGGFPGQEYLYTLNGQVLSVSQHRRNLRMDHQIQKISSDLSESRSERPYIAGSAMLSAIEKFLISGSHARRTYLSNRTSDFIQS